MGVDDAAVCRHKGGSRDIIIFHPAWVGPGLWLAAGCKLCERKASSQRKRHWMALCSVVVPDGLVPGDTFSVLFDEKLFSVEVADGLMAGSAMTLELPVNPPLDDSVLDSKRSNHSEVDVVVPDGVDAGDYFTVEVAGSAFEVELPEGVAAGDSLRVTLPACMGLPSGAIEIERLTLDATDPPASDTEYVCGVREAAFVRRALGESRRMASVVDRRANMLRSDDPNLRRDTTSTQTACTAGAANSTSQAHYTGKRVEVERSDGSFSPASIVAYDAQSDTYTLEVNGGTKWLVETGSIRELDRLALLRATAGFHEDCEPE